MDGKKEINMFLFEEKVISLFIHFIDFKNTCHIFIYQIAQPRVKLDLPPGGFPEYLTDVSGLPPAAYGSSCCCC